MFNAFYRKLFIHPHVIKKKSELFLINKGARICDWLPYIDTDSVIRNSLESGQRAAILCSMCNISRGAPTHIIKEWLKQNALLAHLSSEEEEILGKNEKDLTDQEMINLSWYVESLYAFLWAGSIFDTLPTTEHVPDTLVNFVPNIQKNEPAKSFIKSFKLRSYKQIYEILDLYYRAHWFVRDARLCNEDTKDFNYSTIISRRSALEWIFDTKSDWDDIELST